MNFFAAPPQSLAEEQKNLDNLKQYNPILANSLLSKYMEMVVAAGAGEMETLQTLLLSAGRPPMTWFRVRMFQEGERVDKDAKRESAKWLNYFLSLLNKNHSTQFVWLSPPPCSIKNAPRFARRSGVELPLVCPQVHV